MFYILDGSLLKDLILMPITRPPRFANSKYGGIRPAAKITDAMTPIIVRGQETPLE